MTGFHHHRRQIQHFDAWDCASQCSQAGRIASFLAIHIHPEAGNALEAVGAVKFPCLFKRLALAVVEHREDQSVTALLRQSFITHRPQLAAETSVGGLAAGDMQVTASVFHQFLHQVLDHQLHRFVLSDVVSGSRDIPANLPGVRHHSHGR